MAVKHLIIIGKKKFDYELQPSRRTTLLVIRELGVEQKIPNEDLPQVLLNLPQIISEFLQKKEDGSKQTEVMRFRVSPEEKLQIEKLAIENGFESVSAYIRAVALGKFRP